LDDGQIANLAYLGGGEPECSLRRTRNRNKRQTYRRFNG
jgi:hypothetical protein